MIKSRSKIFAPKKIIRNVSSSQPVSEKSPKVIGRNNSPLRQEIGLATHPEQNELRKSPIETAFSVDKTIQSPHQEASEARDNLSRHKSNINTQSNNNSSLENEKTQVIQSKETSNSYPNPSQTVPILSSATTTDQIVVIDSPHLNVTYPTPSPTQAENLDIIKEKIRKKTTRGKRKKRELTPSPTQAENLDNIKKKIRKKTTRGKRKRRELTPEGAETKKIDPSVITMQDLCRDLRIGKKSKNHDEIMGRLARVKRNAIEAKLQRDNPKVDESIRRGSHGNNHSSENGHLNNSTNSEITPPPAPPTGPRIRIVDGQIVTDEQSLQIDRHKRARENVCEEDDLIEENDFTRIVSCNNYLKRERAQHWDLAANELFWKGLRMFGTDFEMIAKMFPHRSRRQIKLKFNAEERRNPQKLNRVLMGIKTEAIDLDEFQRLGNLELEDLANIKAEQAQIEVEQSERLRVACENT